MEFKKAVKTKSRLRLAVDGVSGSGKTYTALAIASGMGGPIALIDSEHGSASLYADRFEFDTVDLMEFQIENYIEALNAAASANYPIVIVDSTSHAWDALVERVDRIANTLTGGNTSFRAWAQGTPLQKQLIEALLNYPGHVIVTCRSKTEYSIDKDDKGKTTISKVGTAAVQRAGFEYEFTMAMTMDANHVGHVTKDRTSKFQDKFITKPGKDFGQQLIAWLNEGAAPPPPPPKTTEQKCHDAMVEIGNILTGPTESGEKLFTEAEIQTVKANLGVILKNPPETRLPLILKVLEEQKELLQKRLSFLKPDTGDSTETQATPDIPSMYQESEAVAPEEQAPPDDDFEDDIPWGKDDKPDKKNQKGNGKKDNPQPSLADGFNQHMRENAKAKESSKELVTAGALDGELPIY
ncbi:MAG: ATP-binding protein [Treponema sp.]|jgi:hypothetical protein|nr:ATP-binding protein [Treponema sp.]